MTTKTVLIFLAALAGLGCLCLGSVLVLGGLAAGGEGGPGVADPGGADGALVGTWTSGGVSGPALYDAFSGNFETYAGGEGRLLELNGDGTVSFSGMIKTQLGVCVNKIFTHREGTWRASGDTLTLRYTDGSGASYASCGGGVKRLTPSLGSTTYRFSIATVDGIRGLDLVDDDGTRDHYRFGQ